MTERPQGTGDRFEVVAGDWAPGGRCFARLPDGTPLFVERCVPGERVAVEVHRRRARIAEGVAVEVLGLSDDRVAPPCARADRCGGCDWMHVSQPGQIRGKRSILSQASARQARFDLAALHGSVEDIPATPSPEALGYRGRIRLHVNRAGNLGYFARGSREVVEIDRCDVATAQVNDGLAALRSEIATSRPAFGRSVSGVEIRAGDAGTACAIHLFPRTRRAAPGARMTRMMKRLAAQGNAVWWAGKPLLGPSRVRVDVGDGRWILAGPSSFVQANPGANLALVRRVVAMATEIGCESFIDLYCGAGNFSLPLAAAGFRGVGIELSAEAIDLAGEAADTQGIADVVFEQGRADEHLDSRDTAVDLLLLDPPRTGARDAMPSIAALAPRHVLYVGCDPVTQARDVGVLLGGGYEVRAWELFDLFPQTHHVEGVALLHRA